MLPPPLCKAATSSAAFSWSDLPFWFRIELRPLSAPLDAEAAAGLGETRLAAAAPTPGLGELLPVLAAAAPTRGLGER